MKIRGGGVWTFMPPDAEDMHTTILTLWWKVRLRMARMQVLLPNDQIDKRKKDKGWFYTCPNMSQQ